MPQHPKAPNQGTQHPRTRHLRTLRDLSTQELGALLSRAHVLKQLRGTPEHPRPLQGKALAILLEKSSTRTRISFEVGAAELGAQPVPLLAKDTQLGRGEPISDTAHMLSGFVHGVVFRTHGHDRLEELCAHASIPIINGLTDLYHPCQILADLMTAQSAFGENLVDAPVAWVGDGNNMANSWILAAGILGFPLRVACPEKHGPLEDAVTWANGQHTGCVEVTPDVDKAVRGARVVTTDVWASMGQEDEARARAQVFANYNVTAARMQIARKDAIFLHCLPAHRGEEVDADVIDGPQSRVWEEAENRLHAQKALMEHLMASPNHT